jgi:hypothetical protein
MGIRRVVPKFDGRDGRLSDGLQRAYTQKFQVFTDSKTTGPLAVMFAPGIPRLYAFYVSFGATEVDTLALCRDVYPVQDPADWSVWEVTCQFSTLPLGPTSAQGQPSDGGDPSKGDGASNNPELEPPVVRWGWHEKEEAFVKDANGKDVLNSAKQPFDPAPTVERGWRVLYFERNELSFDPDAMDKYSYALNSDNFLGAKQKEVLSKPVTADAVYKGPLRYYRVKYEFHFRKRPPIENPGQVFPGATWSRDILDQGLCKLSLTAGPNFKKPVPIIRNGQPLSQPVLLDGAGQELTPAALAASGPQYISFQPYLATPFAPLNIVLP